MANEQRLIDVNALEANFHETKMIEIFPYWKELPFKTQIELVRFGKAVKEKMQNAPTVDAVPLEQYNELRENFIDFVCSGATNLAPYCKNKFAGCVDRRGWCMQTKWCRGFNPDGERRAE